MANTLITFDAATDGQIEAAFKFAGLDGMKRYRLINDLPGMVTALLNENYIGIQDDNGFTKAVKRNKNNQQSGGEMVDSTPPGCIVVT